MTTFGPIRRHALFDFGGPILLTPFELNHRFEATHDLPFGALPNGPFDPEGDPHFLAWQAGELTERGYWAERASAIGLTVPQYMRGFFEPPGDDLIRPGSWALIREVRHAGFKAGVLTNDLTAFHGPEWVAAINVLGEIDPLVDLSKLGHLKPDPRGYQDAIEAMGVGPDEMVFVDDQPANCAGAERAGIRAVWFDVTDAEGSLVRFRHALAGD